MALPVTAAPNVPRIGTGGPPGDPAAGHNPRHLQVLDLAKTGGPTGGRSSAPCLAHHPFGVSRDRRGVAPRSDAL